MKSTRRQAVTWILAVMAKQAVSMSAEEAEKQAKLSAPAFQSRYAAEAFCNRSLDHVAASERYWNEAAIMKSLDAWQAKETPAGSALCDAAQRAPLDVAGKYWVDRFMGAESDPAAHRVLMLIERYHEAAYRWLLIEDPRASSIAVYHRMQWRSRADYAAEWDDEQAVRRAVRTFFATRPAFTDATLTMRRGDAVNRDCLAVICLNALVLAVSVNAKHHGPAMADEIRRCQEPPASAAQTVTMWD
jgi:hypothetical protein